MKISELDHEEYKEYLKYARDINELRMKNYNKYWRPELIKPNILLKNIKSKEKFKELKFNLAKVLVREQEEPSYRFNVMRENLYDVLKANGEDEIAEKIKYMTQYQAQKIQQKYPDAFNFYFWYKNSKYMTQETYEMQKEAFNEAFEATIQ